jgi:hypothetical protein
VTQATLDQRLKVGDLILRATQAIVVDFPKGTKTRLQRGNIKGGEKQYK